MRTAAFTLTLLLLAGLGLSACGRKGDPLPPGGAPESRQESRQNGNDSPQGTMQEQPAGDAD